jgi:pilus assembly protein CpaF
MKSQAFGKRRRDLKKVVGTGFGRSGATLQSDDTDDSSLAPVASAPANEQPAPSSVNAYRPPVQQDDYMAAGLDDSLNNHLKSACVSKLFDKFSAETVRSQTKQNVSNLLTEFIDDIAKNEGIIVLDTERDEVLTTLTGELEARFGPLKDEESVSKDKSSQKDPKKTLTKAKDQIQPLLMEHIDPAAAADLPRPELAEQVGEVVGELLVQEKVNLNLREQRDLVSLLLDDMLGLGPLEPLLSDESISDIMVNGPQQVYVEQNGKLTLTDVTFRDNQHLMNVAQRIVTAVGRRVDETTPICDARLVDGSRVNVIAPPLAIDGASISIRKFTKDKITLDKMLDFGSITPPLAKLLKIAGACRLNILISGGTGSGKTTMLNALSKMVDKGERVVTIEDAAELQLQQPHVVRLETRPPNLEGQGEITMRDLVKNALRMRPDRIILGEIRGGEAIDMLQAMNTGHDGSMGTIHANRPREGLTRLENMVNMAGLHLPAKAIREQIAGSLDMIVQVQRMRDGGRRTTHVTEVVGMEGDVITTQDLFTYQFTGEDEAGKLVGEFTSTGVRPHFLTKAEYFGLDRALMEAMNG